MCECVFVFVLWLLHMLSHPTTLIPAAYICTVL